MLYIAFTLLSLTALEPSLRFTHVRAMTPPVRALIERGITRSPSLRALVRRLERSDVVVYVYEDRAPARGLVGRLAFQSTAGGFRYVQVRLVLRSGEARNISTLAHELQHAVEIAERPSIVDEASLASAYARIGHAMLLRHGARYGFDTVAAVAAGRRAWQEVRRY